MIPIYYARCYHLLSVFFVIHTVDGHRIKDRLDPFALPTFHRLSLIGGRARRSTCPVLGIENATYELHPSHSGSSSSHIQIHRVTPEVGEYWSRTVLGHLVMVERVAEVISIKVPSDSCENLTTVAETAFAANCTIAVNAGFFNDSDGSCFGGLVSQGRVIKPSAGIVNAHFGIQRDGRLFTGYLWDGMDVGNIFQELVGGVIWLVRDGVNNVEKSIQQECGKTENTGSLQSFADIISARVAIGHDREGRVMILQIDGKSWKRGVDLHELADLLISYGAINAINLDGGGSATLVINGTVVNYPSDDCTWHNMTSQCDRPVSSIVCVRDLPCPAHCSGHGRCVSGQCQCEGLWVGTACDILQCGQFNCSTHGQCTRNGCVCMSGWLDPDCRMPCSHGLFGPSCSLQCRCSDDGTELCDHTDGRCTCKPGFTGHSCDRLCPVGWYGPGCQRLCDCSTISCYCDPVSGACSDDNIPVDIRTVSQCALDSYINKQQSNKESDLQYRLMVVALCSLCLLFCVSLGLNMFLYVKPSRPIRMYAYSDDSS